MEKRAKKRVKIKLPVIYTYLDEYAVSRSEGTTFDICDTGLCFDTNKRLREGHSLLLQIPHVWDVPILCKVKWTRIKTHNSFRIGVSYQ